MKIIPVGRLEEFGVKEVYARTLRQLTCGLKKSYGNYFLTQLENVKIVLFSDKEEVKPICLHNVNFDMDLSQYSYVGIVPEIHGNEPISMTAIATSIVSASGVIGAFGLSSAVALALIDVVAFALTIGLMVGIGALIQAISPTPTTQNAKQAQTKQSNLWNGSQATMLQGGPLPMVFGSPYCNGGTIIANSLTTEDVIIVNSENTSII